jgi:thioredoxin-related protein
MKTLVLTILSLTLAAALNATAADATWSTDLPAAQAKAKKDKKLVVVNFTGSDWCSWCKKLQREVFTTKEWNAFATEKLELVEIDFPNGKKQPDALKKANDALKSKHGADGFPTILVFNSEGKEVWRQVGYMAGGPEAWIGKLKSLK